MRENEENKQKNIRRSRTLNGSTNPKNRQQRSRINRNETFDDEEYRMEHTSRNHRNSRSGRRSQRGGGISITAIIAMLALLILIIALFIVSIVGSNSQKNKLRDALRTNDLATLQSLTVDNQGNPIKADIFEGYKEDVKKAVENELQNNGGANKSITVEYDGFLIKKPTIVLNTFTLHLKDLAPDLIVYVNDKEIKHGSENTVVVAANPGKNLIRYIMNQSFYNDTGSQAEVNFENGLTEAQVNSGYGFMTFNINVNKDAMLAINDRQVQELKAGTNTIILPTNLDLNLTAIDRVNPKIKSNTVKITKDMLNIDFQLNSTTVSPQDEENGETTSTPEN